MSLRLCAYGSGAANAEDELRRGGEMWRGGRVEGANEKDSLREGVGGEEGLGGRQASVRRDWLELSL